MPNPLRNSLALRRYRLAQAITVAGAIAIGSLVVNRLVTLFREDFFLFYGVSDEQYAHVQEQANAGLPLTVGKLVIAAIALVAVCVFVWSERRRIQQRDSYAVASRGSRRTVVVERLSFGSMFDEFVTRTSSFAGLLLSIWLLQSSLERWLGGLGWGIEYADWRSLLPFASIFGLCVLAGMLVAAVSLIGLRAIHVLELSFRHVARRRLRRVSSPKLRISVLHTARTFRELLGCDILSRPPPLAC